MRIHVDQLKSGSLGVAFEEPADRFIGLRELTRSGECEFTSPIRARIRATRIRELVEIEGVVKTDMRLTCGRCLAPFIYPIAVEFALTYTGDRPGDAEGVEAEDREQDAGEAGLIYFQGEEIDLTEGIQEQVILSFPLRPLCRETCRGLCARCGADLNHERCRCLTPPTESPFAALSRLKLD
jgi:uncharacterized protein